MKAYRITDYIIPSLILKNEVIEGSIYEDKAVFTVPDVIREFWIGIEEDNRVLGCYRVHNMGAVLWQIHARVLPDYRSRSKDMTILALKWCSDNIPTLNKIMAYVPKVHKNVAKHAIEVGFTLEGTLTGSYLKDGVVIDQDIFGITKDTIDSL